MRIKDWDIRKQPDTLEVSADIDGFRLWYRIPGSLPVSRTGDPFLAAALLPSMAKGETLEIDPGLPISPRLLEHAGRLQEIHHCWNPALKVVPISARTAPAQPTNRGAFSFFSGGVDAMFTFLRRREEISHAVFIHGFDFFVDPSAFRKAVERNTEFVGGFGKTLIPVETNFYRFGYSHNLSRVLTQGSTLAGVALLLGFRRAFVPSSDHYSHLAPLGSHPLTDPLYSNEWVEVVHDSADMRRIDKVVQIADSDSALANLTVCLEDMNANCGRCIKCLRTMIALELIGASSTAFPWPLSLKAVKRTNWSFEPVLLGQNIDLAFQRGNRKLHRVLLARQRKYERSRLIKDVDRVLLGGIVKRAFRRISKNEPAARRISTTPAKE